MPRAKPAQARRSSALTIKHLAAEVRAISKVDQADLVDTKDLAARANGRGKVTPISKALLVFPVGPADAVNTKDPSVLADLVAQANLAGRAEVTPISKAVPVHPAVLGAAKVRANQPSAAKTRI